MISVLLLIITVFAGLIGWWFYEFFKYEAFLSKFNGPVPLPIIGNLYRISRTADILPVVTEYLKKHGSVIKMWFGFRPRIIIADYRTAEILMNSTTILDKSYDYEFFKPWLGEGLVTSTGNKWRRRRKLLTPTFHFQILQQYISIFNNQGDILKNIIQDLANGGPVDIYSVVHLCALDIIGEAVMGVQFKAQTHESSEYVHSVAGITTLIFERMFSIFLTFDSIYKLTNSSKRYERLLGILHKHTNDIISQRESELIKSKLDGTQSVNEFGIKKRKAFLDLLLECRESGANLTTEDIREEVETFMFAGHDTTSCAILFALYNLAQHKEVQENVVAELRSVFNNEKDRAPSYQDLQDLKYLEQVIKESLRLYPPVPLIARELTEDTEFDGVIIPKGTNLTVLIYGLHRREEIYPDPEKFDPERFTPENSASRSPFAYLPFSAGVRNCIGQRFAMLAVKSVLAKILLHFELEPVPDFKPMLALESILRSHNGLLINMKERK